MVHTLHREIREEYTISCRLHFLDSLSLFGNLVFYWRVAIVRPFSFVVLVFHLPYLVNCELGQIHEWGVGVGGLDRASLAGWYSLKDL